MIILFITYLFYLQVLNEKKKKKIVPKLRQEVKVNVDIVTTDDIKIYYTGKFQDFTARYIINRGCFFSVKDRNSFHRVDTIGNIFTSGAATKEKITDDVHEMK